ncbi:MAG: hypothetical protein M3253_07625 [Chloroflexota bacterium]|nr:hypothetical protein [Chloroflexota bacterium]
MNDEVGLEREDERHALRAEDIASEEEATGASSEQVGVGMPPGQPPASGTSERSHHTSAPASGRLDAERATWGASEATPGSVPGGAPPENVGGPQGDTPADSVGDFPEEDKAEEAGVYEPRERRSAGRADLPPRRAGLPPR